MRVRSLFCVLALRAHVLGRAGGLPGGEGAAVVLLQRVRAQREHRAWASYREMPWRDEQRIGRCSLKQNLMPRYL